LIYAHHRGASKQGPEALPPGEQAMIRFITK
jgi:hypothetical protein